jgi:hypothetical protein
MFYLTNKVRQWYSKHMTMEDVEDIEMNRYSPAKGKKKWFDEGELAELEGIV